MRILWLKNELLHPVDRGGRIRTYQMLRELRKHAEVTYLAPSSGTLTPQELALASEYSDHLRLVQHSIAARRSPAFVLFALRTLLSPLPLNAARNRSVSLREAIVDELALHRPTVIVSDFPLPAVNLPERLGVPLVLFQHNVEARLLRRQMEACTTPFLRQYLTSQWKRMQAFEGLVAQRADAVVTVSPDDADAMREDYGIAQCTVVPTGVDVTFFRAAKDARARPNHLVFTGAMDWLPNEDAMSYFVASVLPRIRLAVSDVSLTIVGRNPSAAMRALADEPGVSVTGTVPDVRPYLEQAAVFISPIRVGGGTRLKIYEAMAMDLPVVSTTIGAEGLPLRDGVHLRIADDADSFARAVVDLLRSPSQALSLGSAGGEYVRSNFGWASAARCFLDACASASAPGAVRVPSTVN